ncbi:MAG: hypothetical protein GXP62_01540 [Oligoflexia bacterium]|nr:hypothetical protein [Oligoflexia bacterium]
MSLFQALVMWLCTMASPDSSTCASQTDAQQTPACSVQSSGPADRSDSDSDCDCVDGGSDSDNIYNGF